jgi:hypothetical protein
VALLRPARGGPRKMHRIGVASVQPTRSTLAEAIACRESLRPSALRARCTRKATDAFRARQARLRSNFPQIPTKPFRAAFPSGLHSAQPARRSAPRPVLLRPASRPTAAEATAARRAINLRRSVLGAIRRLRSPATPVKPAGKRIPALCVLFFTIRTYLRYDGHALHERDQRFAEPGALSSTSPTDLPLPRTALRESFVLVASRARRSGNLRCRRGGVQGDPST